VGLTVDGPAAPANVGMAHAEPASTMMTTSRSPNRRPRPGPSTTGAMLGRGRLNPDKRERRARAGALDRSRQAGLMSSPGTDDSVDAAPSPPPGSNNEFNKDPTPTQYLANRPHRLRVGLPVAVVHTRPTVRRQSGLRCPSDTCSSPWSIGQGKRRPERLISRGAGLDFGIIRDDLTRIDSVDLLLL